MVRKLMDPIAQTAHEKTAGGFWLVQFTGLTGLGQGVVTLVNGKLFGGDSAFLYTGSYRHQGEELHASVHVAAIFAGARSVMEREEFDLVLTGRFADKLITAAGSIPGTTLAFDAVLIKKGDFKA